MRKKTKKRLFDMMALLAFGLQVVEFGLHLRERGEDRRQRTKKEKKKKLRTAPRTSHF